jgi:hypothetical protein
MALLLVRRGDLAVAVVAAASLTMVRISGHALLAGMGASAAGEVAQEYAGVGRVPRVVMEGETPGIAMVEAVAVAGQVWVLHFL